MKTQTGVSLIEVLVSITIIMILAGLLLPTYFGATHTAKMTVSMSNLQQIHHAAMLYEGDNGSLPPWNVRDASILGYFGGVVPRSPAAVLDPPEDDYYLVGHFGLLQQQRLPLDYECSLKRDSDYVLAYDLNFAATRVARQSGSRWYLLIRKHGGVDRKPADLMDRSGVPRPEDPCPGASFWSNF